MVKRKSRPQTTTMLVAKAIVVRKSVGLTAMRVRVPPSPPIQCISSPPQKGGELIFLLWVFMNYQANIHYISESVEPVIVITIFANNRYKYPLNFYRRKDGKFINDYYIVANEISKFLVENGFVTLYQKPTLNIEYGLQLTTKALLMAL